MRRISLLYLLLLPAIAPTQSSLPDLPPDIPKDVTVRLFLSDGKPAGQDAVWQTPDGAIHEFFQFNDRGRGPKTYTTYRLDAAGLITSEETSGVDYMKSPVEERFALTSATANWKNQAENVTVSNASGKFYVDLNGGPESSAILARALLHSPSHSLPVLPSGQAKIRKLQSVSVGAQTATLYEITGLSFTPNYLWLDADNRYFASVSGWGSIIRRGFESDTPRLLESQRTVEVSRAVQLAKTLAHKPAGPVVIKNVTLFDSVAAKTFLHQRITIQSDRIASIEPEKNQATPAAAEIVDGSNKMLLPGLWDMHSHLFADSAFLNIAAGVTTVRDLGNSIDELTKLRAQIDSGAQIGPRVVPAGFIDGPGPFEGPIKVLAATPEEARQRVDRYADLGYKQIKIYSSVKPELVPVIIEEAHKRGLRVSGHIPANMIAEQFVRAGADEIQHMNFIFLNFMPDVKETRTPARFIEPGKRGGTLDLNSTQVNEFVALLKQRHTVIDPTMGVWEGTYLDRPGEISHTDAAIFDRLPVQAQRGSKSGGGALGATDPATDKLYRATYANMVRMLKKLYDSGVPIVAGTDAGSGWAFDRELEIYQEAGIPAPQVLRMATFEAARLMHRDSELGSVAPGKLADLILVNGKPTERMSDIRRVELVIKSGNIYRPSEMYPAFGIRP